MKPLDGTCQQLTHGTRCTKPTETEWHRYCVEHGERAWRKRIARRARRQQITDSDVVSSGGDAS